MSGDLVQRLREWRAGSHVVFDDQAQETGEYVDEPKRFETMQLEREEAAVELERLRVIEQAARNLHPESRGDSKRYHLVTKSRYAALREALSPNPSETGGRES